MLQYLVILIGVLSVSSASVLFQFASADPLVIAFYRLAISAALLGLPVLFRRGGRAAVSRHDIMLSMVSGVFLALHFGFWFFSLRLTSIAASTVLANMHPLVVLAGNYALYGQRTRGGALAGVLAAVTGAAVVGWGDFQLDSTALLGDGLAFLAAVTVSGYFMIGSKVRQSLDALSYSVTTYSTAAALLALTALLKGAPLVGHTATDWLVFLGMAIFPTILGHTLFNWALRRVPASVVSVTILGEPVGATLLAWMLWRTVPSSTTFLGGGLILAGMALFLLKGTRNTEQRAPVPAVETGTN